MVSYPVRCSFLGQDRVWPCVDLKKRLKAYVKVLRGVRSGGARVVVLELEGMIEACGD